MQWFKVDLKTFLGLAMPNQCSQTVRKPISNWFCGDNFGPKSPNHHDPYMRPSSLLGCLLISGVNRFTSLPLLTMITEFCLVTIEVTGYNYSAEYNFHYL